MKYRVVEYVEKREDRCVTWFESLSEAVAYAATRAKSAVLVAVEHYGKYGTDRIVEYLNGEEL